MVVMSTILEKIQEKCDPNLKEDIYDLKGMDRAKEVSATISQTIH